MMYINCSVNPEYSYMYMSVIFFCCTLMTEMINYKSSMNKQITGKMARKHANNLQIQF